MNSSVKVVSLERVASPLLAVALGELHSAKLPDSLLPLDAALSGAIAGLLATGDFSGKRDEVEVLFPRGRATRIS